MGQAWHEVGQPVEIDWNEPTPERRFAKLETQDPELARAIREGVWPHARAQPRSDQGDA